MQAAVSMSPCKAGCHFTRGRQHLEQLRTDDVSHGAGVMQRRVVEAVHLLRDAG